MVATPPKTNQAWLDDLRGPERDAALEALRTLLVRSLTYAMRDRASVTEADIEDFVQDALLKILDNLDTFRGESRFTTWANKIAVHVALSELRRRRWKDVSLQDLTSQDAQEDFVPIVAADPGPQPEQSVTQQMLLELVLRLIAEQLTDRQRQAMQAVMLHGMNLQEVAVRMGTNRNALYKLLHDARKRLKKHLLEQGLSPQEILAAFET